MNPQIDRDRRSSSTEDEHDGHDYDGDDAEDDHDADDDEDDDGGNVDRDVDDHEQGCDEEGDDDDDDDDDFDDDDGEMKKRLMLMIALYEWCQKSGHEHEPRPHMVVILTFAHLVARDGVSRRGSREDEQCAFRVFWRSCQSRSTRTRTTVD